MKFCHSLVPYLLVFLLFGSPLKTAAAKTESHWSGVWENDAIADDDGGYTNGIALNWGYRIDEQRTPQWVHWTESWLPFPAMINHQRAVSYQLSHSIFTPSDIENPELIEDDRPYSGLFYGAMNLYQYNTDQASRYELLLGMVGPATGAEHFQRFIHDRIGTNDPKGWAHQVSNELVVRVAYEQLWQLHQAPINDRLAYDVIAGGDIRAGNLNSDLGAGITLRLGRGLSNSFPMAWLTPARGLPALAGSLPGEWNLFATLYGSYVFNDITIEGNTFKESHGVTLKHLQGRYLIGGNYTFDGWTFSGSIQESTDGFEESDESTLFATFGFSIHWK